MKVQCWVLPPLEARIAESITFSISASGTGSGLKCRSERALYMASNRSILPDVGAGANTARSPLTLWPGPGLVPDWSRPRTLFLHDSVRTFPPEKHQVGA